MAHWDSSKGVTIYYPPEPIEGYSGWFWLDCGCSGGLEWGGEQPRECGRCILGRIALHQKSKRLALYPGGPFCGVASPQEIASVEERQ